MNNLIQQLRCISLAPARAGGAFDAWLEQSDAFALLDANALDKEFVVYAALPFTFIYAVAVPLQCVAAPDVDDLLRWSANPYSSWSVEYRLGKPPAVSIAQPLSGVDSKVLAKGEQLIYGRTFDGRQEDKRYFEVLQKFAHLLGLHYVPERRCYCRVDKRGDVEDIVRIVALAAEGRHEGGTIITIDRSVLDEYLALTDAAVVRLFDFTRYERNHFGGWRALHKEERIDRGDLHYRMVLEKGHASYSRGFQLVRSSDSKAAICRRFSSDEPKQYASFIAQDWKNNVIAEISCDPKCLASYFQESNLPFEITPAFFRPEVLLKYKKNPEKYLLEDRSLTSRNAWYLETYDVNEAGQVHTYLVYLSRLPYDEQLYWKSFNESPRAPISKRAFTTDIKGEFYGEYDPLSSLKQALRELQEQHAPWWKLRSSESPDQVHYPITSSSDEWADELHALDKLLVEGLETAWLRSEANRLGRAPKAQLRALKLAEECLVGLGYDDEDARDLMAPFHEVHNLRQIRGHATGKDAAKIRAATISSHRTYRNHFESLCSRCDKSIRGLAEAFGTPVVGGVRG